MSDQDTNLFNSNEEEEKKPNDPVNSSDNATNSEVVEDPYKDLVALITREDGSQKFSDTISALKAIPHQDNHIKTLEMENKTLRESLEQQKNVKELLEGMKATPTGGNDKPTSEGLSAEQVAQIAADVLQSQRNKETAENNIKAVTNKFRELYGDEADVKFYKKAEELGLGHGFINDLAGKSPKAVFNLYGIEAEEKPHKTTETPKGSVNTEGMPTNKQTGKPKTVMRGATSTEIADAWKDAEQRVKERLGIQ